jgi:hypothetical protein
MHWHMHQASRYRAKSKRSGLRCRAPAVRASEVCRMRGTAGGAPRGNRNAIKHGEFAAKTLALKREIQALARTARETIGSQMGSLAIRRRVQAPKNPISDCEPLQSPL